MAGYSPNIGPRTEVHPRRGRRRALNRQDVFIILRHKRKDKSKTINDKDGFKVYLHHPTDLPQSSVSFYEAPSERKISMGIKLKITNTSNSLRSYLPDTRRCYFPGERQLRYFLTYTENNCKLECTANRTLKHCRCVWFHMPHNETSTICRPRQKWCGLEAIRLSDEVYDFFNKVQECRCYPLCLNIQYEADIKEAKYNTTEIKQINSRDDIEYYLHLSECGYKYTRIDLFYKAPKFVAMHRSELFGLTDFIANCGALLGLFLGFSFLSLVEIVYFCTLRFGCSLYRSTQTAENTTEKNEKRFGCSLCHCIQRAENTSEKNEER